MNEVIISITDSNGELDPSAVGGALNDVFGRLQVTEANQAATTRILKAIADNIDGPISEDLAKALKNKGADWGVIAAAALPLLAINNQNNSTPPTPLPPAPGGDVHATPWTVAQQAVNGTGNVILSAALVGAGFTFAQDSVSVPSDRFGRITITNNGGAPFNVTLADLFDVVFSTAWNKIPRIEIRVEQDQALFATNVYSFDSVNYVKNGGLLTGFQVQSLPQNLWAVGQSVVFTWDTMNRPGE